LNPEDDHIRNNLSYMLTDRARGLMKDADTDRLEKLLLEALAHKQDNGTALVMLGDIYYRYRSDFTKAISVWEKAHGTMEALEWKSVADRIAQARRDLFIERDYVSEKSNHFDIRFQSKDHAGVSDFAQWLEKAYGKLHSQLDEGPETVTVIVYADNDIHRTYNQRDWAVGFYDGRLRLKGSELSSPWAGSLILHELAHAFLHHAYADTIPVWVHEGFAQIQEGPHEKSDDESRMEHNVKSGNAWVPLKWLDQKFARPSDRDDASRAYVQAHLVVEELIERHGLDRFKNFLSELSEGSPAEAAYDKAFSPDRWARTDRPIFR
jgi:tetratricopeptide (TPR) repeat protein